MTTGSIITPLVTGSTRVFLIEGRAGPNHAPLYESSLRAGALEHSKGDVTKLEGPDPNNYGKFITLALIKGKDDFPATTLQGRFPADQVSILRRLSELGCDLDIHYHIGQCSNPSMFNKYTKCIIIESCMIGKWSVGDLGALESGENKGVDETCDLKAIQFYEIVPLNFSIKASAQISNEMLDVVIVDDPSCGDCGTQSDGCSSIYAVSKAAPGSPSTPANVVYSIDRGVNWYQSNIDGLGATNDPSAVDGLAGYIVVISQAYGGLAYASRSDLAKVYNDTDWAESQVGFVPGKGPNDISSTGTFAFIVGQGGYVYGSRDPGTGVVVLDAGSAVQDDLMAVHALSDKFAVAVGKNGAIIRTIDGQDFTAMPRFLPLLTNITSVHCLDENNWLVGTSTGHLYYTTDSGYSWTEKVFYGSGSGSVTDIKFSTRNVGFMSHTTAAGTGRILRTIDGGYSWVVLPEGNGSIPANKRVNRIAACGYDPNLVVGAGLASDNTNGLLLLAA